MSENLDLVRSVYEPWERGDFSASEWAHPQIEYLIVDGPEPSRWTGLAGMIEGFRGFLRLWEDWHVVADEYRELDDERVLVLLHYSGRGKGSGLTVDHMQTKGASLFHVHRGKVTRLVVYFERERALADLGLTG
jgi:ketosteroid isomerase-like protein